MIEFDNRPWGRWEEYLNEPGYRVKRIIVNPGGILSLQKHAQRREYWVVVQGTGKARKGDDTFNISPGDTVHIEIGEIHRLQADPDAPLVLIEVQMGNCIEDDIERLEDIYGRVKGGSG